MPQVPIITKPDPQTALLVLISGPCCSGKSTLASFLSQRLHLPLISKDALKEELFKILPLTDPTWLRQLGEASNQVIFHILEQFVSSNQGGVFESNFSPELHRYNLASILRPHNGVVIEIYCTAKVDILESRFIARSPYRNRAHNEKVNAKRPARGFLNVEQHTPLNISNMLTLDTSDVASVNYEKLLREISTICCANSQCADDTPCEAPVDKPYE